ncbi:MAG: magnesium transporter CorA family protein [Opitutaceae bacterium]|nr:magnesium transporter CorA family protein [Opitutaceae bacterium]
MITTLVYRDTRFVASNPPVETLAALRAEANVMLWVDLAAPTDAEIKLVLENLFAFHPLAIEDCVTDSPLPKLEEYDDYLYLVMHAVDYSRADKFTTTELDLFLGKNFLVTFHRQPLKPVQAALDRYLKSPGTNVRGPDRFAHVILDLMVEAYKPALDELHRELDEIESGVLHQMSADELFPRVAGLRKELSALRQIVRPQREIAAVLTQGKNRFIRPLIVPYLRDLAEDLSRIEAQAGAWAEQLILTFRVYLNKSGHEANLGIRVLTGITAITLPVMIIGGWYGMNFDRMHETEAPYSYFIALALMLAGTVGMLFFLRSKKWL